MNQDLQQRQTSSTVGVQLVLMIIDIALLVIVLILAAAFFLGLLGANMDSPFAHWITTRTSEFMRPFNGIFSPVKFSDKVVIRPSLLVGMAVYSAIAGIVTAASKHFRNLS